MKRGPRPSSSAKLAPGRDGLTMAKLHRRKNNLERVERFGEQVTAFDLRASFILNTLRVFNRGTENVGTLIANSVFSPKQFSRGFYFILFNSHRKSILSHQVEHRLLIICVKPRSQTTPVVHLRQLRGVRPARPKAWPRFFRRLGPSSRAVTTG